jgi:hypothetical protein
MAIIIDLASSSKQRLAAHQLVKKTYLKKFKVNIDKLHLWHPEQFESDTLLVYTEDSEEVLGTMSIMYPNQHGIFPCESLFGFNLTPYSLASKQYVEVGRFATEDKAKENWRVVVSLFLGAIKLLKTKQINGWTATVKDEIYSFLNKLPLPVHNIEQLPNLKPNDPLNFYVKQGASSGLHLFDVSMEETMVSFQKYNRFLAQGHIKIAF